MKKILYIIFILAAFKSNAQSTTKSSVLVKDTTSSAPNKIKHTIAKDGSASAANKIKITLTYYSQGFGNITDEFGNIITTEDGKNIILQ